jgi:hypothetical protein
MQLGGWLGSSGNITVFLIKRWTSGPTFALNLGCPILDDFQGWGFSARYEWPFRIPLRQSMHVKIPILQELKDGAPKTSKSSVMPGPPAPLISRRGNDLLEHLCDIFASAFRGDDHAGIQDQSHAGGLRGSRWLWTTASRSRPKSPSSVTVEPWSSARATDSERRQPG